MKLFKHLSLLLVFVSFTKVSQAQNCWQQVWSDEFNGTSLNTADWNYDLGNGVGGWGNNEKEYYTNSTQNVSVSGGYLNLTARYQANYNGTGLNFTSGKIHTRNNKYWTYGRMEALMKLPVGTGTWPAFWMLPQNSSYGGWPTSGEIDIMEYRGDQNTKMNGTLHYGNASPNNQYDGTDYYLTSGNFNSAFHLFAVEWEPGEIRWYVDNYLFKTEKETPNSLDPASNNAVKWPWKDNNFYIILNLAIGGWYSGNPSDASIINGNTSWTQTLQIDYVRVYTDLSGGQLTGVINGKSSVVPSQSVTYSVPASAGATYNWTLPTGATIVSGQNTNSIDVTWGNASGEVKVRKTVSCGYADYVLAVTTMPTTCGTMLEDFENIRFNQYGYIHGQFGPHVANPAPSTENTSPFCAQYTRNPSEDYDIIIVENPGLGDADLIKNNSKRFMMDTYTDAVGRVIEITLENSNTSSGTYPIGRHSTYRATSTKANAWETLTFTLVATPDASVVGTSVNRLVLFYTPTVRNNSTYYFDNLMLDETPAVGAITGAATVCNNQENVSFTVPNKSGITYTWTAPTGATITSGQTTNAVNVTFATAGGNVTVTPSIGTCSGTAASKAITNNNCSTTGISDTRFSNMSIYPNPANDVVTLQLGDLFQSGAVKIQLLENTGRLISENNYQLGSGNEVMIPVSQLNAGQYLIKITDGEHSAVKALYKK